MSKVLIDSDLLEMLCELGECAIHRMGSYLAEKHNEQRFVDAGRAILAQPAADCGLEVVGYQWLNTGHFRKYVPKAASKAQWSPLIRRSDADARIAELEAKWRTEHDTANRHIMEHCTLRAELSELKEELDDANSGCQKWYLEAVKRGKELAALKARERLGRLNGDKHEQTN